jgi:proteasome accessory factor B
MDRTERLLDLVALLLDAQEPLSWGDIRAAFPDDYGGASLEAAERKFERDKAELLELGIPIGYVQADEDRPDGYVVDKNSYYLPEVGLTKEELALLYTAGSAALASGAFPGSQDLAHALRKMSFFAGNSLPVPKVRLELGAVADSAGLPSRLEALWSAISSRKSVDLTYWSPHSNSTTERKVDPYGLALRRGVWSLVGHCHLRGGVRTFHVHRVRKLTVNPRSPRTADFEVPRGFSLDAYVATWPWQHRFHAPVNVELELTGDLAPLAASLFPQAAKGEARFTVPATDLDGLLKYVLSLGANARVVGPPEATARFKTLAQAIADAHQTLPLAAGAER